MCSKPANILYLSSFSDLSRGGQQSLFYLVTNIDRNVFRPHVIFPDSGTLQERLAEQAIDTHVLNFPKIFTIQVHRILTALYDLNQFCKKNRIDLIHTDGPRNTFYGGIIAKFKKIPLVWHVRASNRDSYDRILYYLSSKVILVAQALRHRFDRFKKDDKFITIYNGVDLAAFRIRQSNASIRKQYGIAAEDLVITVTARIERLKGQKFLIEACGRLKDSAPNCRIVLAGEIVDTAYLKECREAAVACGIEDKVIYTGHLHNVVAVLNETDIFVLPSLFEAFPRAVIEAMGAGKPVVVTDVGGCAEAVEPDVSGFVVPPGNASALGDVLLRLGKDKQLRDAVGKAARNRAEKMFSIKENIRQTEKVYHELLAAYHRVIS